VAPRGIRRRQQRQLGRGEHQTKEVASLGSRPVPRPNHANTKTAGTAFPGNQDSRQGGCADRIGRANAYAGARAQDRPRRSSTRATAAMIPAHIGPKRPAGKDVVLDVALRLKNLMRRKGSSVLLTRRDDTFIPLKSGQRSQRKKPADLFISVHANASRDPDARGVETSI